MTIHRRTTFSLSLLAATFAAGAAMAADTVVNLPASRAPTVAALTSARAFVNPLARPANAANTRAEPMPNGLVPGVSGNSLGAPTTSPNQTRAYGSFGVPYQAERVEYGPTGVRATAGQRFLSATYPYRTVGLLTFNVGGGSAYCSASVILSGVIVTAAHCIQNFGSGANIFTNFAFTPAYYGLGTTPDEIAPYGTFTARALVRPDTWANGTDIGSGAARENDLAVIALNPLAGKFIAQVVGNLRYGSNSYGFVSSARTGNLAVAEVATLGYPGLLDDGKILQRSNGPAYLTTVGNAPQILQGSPFTGGSSGGPWVVNFRFRAPILSGGAVHGSYNVTSVIGVTSWGTADPNAPKDNYSSRFGQNTRYPNSKYGSYGAGNIGALLQTLCEANAGGGQTYAQAGYCDV